MISALRLSQPSSPPPLTGVAAGGTPPPLVFQFSLSDDLLRWSAPTFLKSTTDRSVALEAYPSLLDEVASAGRANVDRVGRNTSCLYYMHTKGNNKQFWAVGPHPGLDHAWAIANVFPSHPELIPDNGWMVYEKTGKYWEPGKMEITCVLKELPSSYHDGL